MDKKWFFCFVFFMVLGYGFSQTNKNYNSHFIVLTNGDTLTNLVIIDKATQTNEDILTYKDTNNNLRNLTASQIKSYFNVDRKCYSEYISSLKTNKLIEYRVDGYLKFGRSIVSSGYNYYYIFNGVVVCVSESKKIFESFFQSNPEIDDFRKKYNKRVVHNYKSLAEFASAYNEYKFPDKYVFVDYSNKKEGAIGIFTYGGTNKISIDGLTDLNLNNIGLGVGFESKFSNKFSFLIQPSYNIAKQSNSKLEANITSFLLSNNIEFTIFEFYKSKIQMGLGVDFFYNYIGYVKMKHEYYIGVTEDYSFDKLNIALNINLLLEFSKHHKVFMNYKTMNNSVAAVDQQITNDDITGKSKILNLGYIFNF